jgi:signal transduction histidine kinase
VTNIIITLVAMIFLNIYSTATTHQMVYQNKESSMISKAQLTASEIATLEVLNPTTASNAVSRMSSLQVSRMIVTDQSGLSVYDSANAATVGQYVLLPEIVDALNTSTNEYGQKSFTWDYEFSTGNMYSYAAVPVVSYGKTIGAVYIMEHDAEQGQLIRSLQQNVFSITLILVLAVILFTIFFSSLYSLRVRRFLSSMRIIREGNYAHRVSVGGWDELAYLGQEFNDLTDRLNTSENKRRQFVSDASHELKTPLASIKLLSDSILQNEMDVRTIREFVQDIGNEADRLTRMSEKLLSLTRIESQEDGTCEIVMLSPTIARAVRMLSGTARENNITIVQEIEEDVPILILEDDLYQIVFNLLENGIKYNQPNGKLTIRVCRQGDNALLQVTDTGMGIPEDAIGHIFERFYRVDKARSRKTGGSGLGLAIVRNLVERNQGTIRAESIYGNGTTFHVTFPAFDMGEEQFVEEDELE